MAKEEVKPLQPTLGGRPEQKETESAREVPPITPPAAPSVATEIPPPAAPSVATEIPPPDVPRFACDTWLFSQEHPAGKLFLAGEAMPDMTVFVDTPAKL